MVRDGNMMDVDPTTWSEVGVLGTRAVVMATGGRGTTETGAIHTASPKYALCLGEVNISLHICSM